VSRSLLRYTRTVEAGGTIDESRGDGTSLTLASGTSGDSERNRVMNADRSCRLPLAPVLLLVLVLLDDWLALVSSCTSVSERVEWD
jgi:hypothetical protein